MIYMIECCGKHKIGVTADIDRRLKQLNYNPFPVSLLCVTKPVAKAYLIEKELHSLFEYYHNYREWFDFKNKETLKWAIDCIISVNDELY